MGKFYTQIPSFLIPWIQEQKLFWVATAPLSASGHVNVSPKGTHGTFHVHDETKVWYEDMSGSGAETIAHLRENERITIMFSAFEGPPRIVRLFGTGTVHEFDTPGYNALIPLNKRQPGSRSVIVVDVHKVGSSCGFSIPFYTFKAERMKLHNMAARKEIEDIKAETCTPSNLPESGTAYTTATAGKSSDSTQDGPPLPENGLKSYWKNHNAHSIDGLPAVRDGFKSTTTFDESIARKDWGADDERMSTKVKQRNTALAFFDVKMLTGFVMGLVVSVLLATLRGGLAVYTKA